jgi:hypothetical protein
MTPKRQTIKAKIDKWDIKLKTLILKGHSQQSKKATHRIGEMPANHIYDNRLNIQNIWSIYSTYNKKIRLETVAHLSSQLLRSHKLGGL